MSLAPIIQIQFTGIAGTDENFIRYLEDTKACYDNRQKIAIIFDATNAIMPSLKHQKMQALWLKENKELMEKYCIGTAYIIPNIAIRTVLKMIFSFQSQPVPYRVIKTNEEAMTWVKNLLIA